MHVRELNQTGLKHEIEITLEPKYIDERMVNRLKEVIKNISMPGFRKGKVPLSMAKKKYGKAIMGEVLEVLVNETSQKVLEDKKLRPALQPKIEVKSFDDGKELVYTMAVEVLPKFEVGNLKGIKLKKLVAKPTDKDIDEALEKIAANSRQTKPVEGKRGAKEGDTVIINFRGRTADDNKEHDGMAMEGHALKLGSGQFIAGFEDQLKGAKAGEKVEVKVTFPKDYGAKELAGRDAIFDVEVTELREPANAEINDEFAKSLGQENVEALRKAVAEQLQKEFDYHSRLHLKKTLMDRLDETHTFEIPPGMLDMELSNILRQVEMDRKGHRHTDSCGDDCVGDKTITDDEKNEFKEIAERRVRLGLILSEVGNENKITVSDPELQRAVIAEAQRYPGQERQVFEFYSKNRNALESMRAPLFEEKVVDYILALAEITEKEVLADELVNAIESEEEELQAKKKGGSKKTSSEEKAEKPKTSKKKK